MALVEVVDNIVAVALVEVVDNIAAVALVVALVEVVAVDNTVVAALVPVAAAAVGNTAAVAADSIEAMVHNLEDSVVAAVAGLAQPHNPLDTFYLLIPLNPFYFIFFLIIVKFETFFYLSKIQNLK